MFVLCAFFSNAVRAQIINGDLNHNNGLDVGDITLLIDGYLTNTAETMDYYAVDNTPIVGTWYESYYNSIVFEADGTYGNGLPYKFLPAQGEILLLDAEGDVVSDFRVIDLTADKMVIKRNDGTYLKLTRTRPPLQVVSITLNETSLELKQGDLVKLTATVLPTEFANVQLLWTSSDDSVAVVANTGIVEAIGEGTATITCAATDGSDVTATCEVIVTPPASVHEAVDLGLSVKWATMNIGIDVILPVEYGDYFAWGETEPKSTYNWSTYKWCNGSSATMTKYCTSSSYGTVDNKTVLDLFDDVARANWGGSWRMPTHDEFTELRTKCTWEWTTQDGIPGRKVTGPNGNSIFLPVAGWRYDSSFNDTGHGGYYWSSSLNTSNNNDAYYLYFDSSTVGWGDGSRYRGFSVRAVCP